MYIFLGKITLNSQVKIAVEEGISQMLFLCSPNLVVAVLYSPSGLISLASYCSLNQISGNGR